MQVWSFLTEFYTPPTGPIGSYPQHLGAKPVGSTLVVAGQVTVNFDKYQGKPIPKGHGTAPDYLD
jgi:hypothetical protein